MDKIIEQLIDKMDETSYDDTVILGTLLVLLESNKSAYGAVLKPENIEITEDTDIFTDIVSVLLNGITVEKEFKFKDFTAKYNNLPQKSLIDDSEDLEKTQKNFEQNFVNLAQVFYEMQFCGDKLENTDTNIQNLMVLVENILLTKRKSLQVTYYNNKRLSNDDRIKQEEFANIANVDFERVPTLRDLKKKVSVPTDSAIKHQIVVLDDPAMGDDKIQELINLCNVYTVFILVNIPGFKPLEKELVRTVSIMTSHAAHEEPIIEGGAKQYLDCEAVKRIITYNDLAIGRHIFSSSVRELKKKLSKDVKMETLNNCLKTLNYTTIDDNDKKCQKVLTLLKDIFKNDPESVNMIGYEQYQELIETRNETQIQSCLQKLGYKYQSCSNVKKFIDSNQDVLDEDNYVDYEKVKQKNQNISDDELKTCIPILGYQLEDFGQSQEPVSSSAESKIDEQYCNEVNKKIAEKEYNNYNEILQDFPDEEKLSKCLQIKGYLSEDCVNVLNEIRTKNYAIGKFITQPDYDQLLEKINNNEDELNKCLKSLGFEVAKDDCAMILPALKQLIEKYKITGNALTLEQYNELLKLVFRDKEPTEEERVELNKCLKNLDYKIEESKPKTDQPSSICETLRQIIEDKNVAIGKYVLSSDLNGLLLELKKSHTNATLIDINTCFETLGYTVYYGSDDEEDEDACSEETASILKDFFKQYPSSKDLIRNEDFQNFLKLNPKYSEENLQINDCLYNLGYEFDTPVPDIVPNLSTDASSTDVSPPGATVDVASSAVASTADASTADASTDASSPSSPEKPDPLKHKIGMYHGCSYKGYDFRAKIEETPQHTEVSGEDIETIVRYFIFSNIVVFIVN